MSRIARFAVACVIGLSVTVAAAGELIYFNNGTFLRIESHELKGDMIQVQLDASSRLAFPMRVVERIEGVTGVVWGKGSGASANQAIPGVALPPDANPGVRGFAPGMKKSWTPEQGSGLRGSNPAQTGFGMAGSSGDQSYLDGVVLQSYRGTPEGTAAQGNKVIVNPEVMTSRGRAPVRFGAKGAAPAAIPTPTNPIVPVPVANEVPPELDPPEPGEDSPEPEPDPGDEGDPGGN